MSLCGPLVAPTPSQPLVPRSLGHGRPGRRASSFPLLLRPSARESLRAAEVQRTFAESNGERTRASCSRMPRSDMDPRAQCAGRSLGAGPSAVPPPVDRDAPERRAQHWRDRSSMGALPSARIEVCHGGVTRAEVTVESLKGATDAGRRRTLGLCAQERGRLRHVDNADRSKGSPRDQAMLRLNGRYLQTRGGGSEPERARASWY